MKAHAQNHNQAVAEQQENKAKYDKLMEDFCPDNLLQQDVDDPWVPPRKLKSLLISHFDEKLKDERM